jgi:hypothetical protein
MRLCRLTDASRDSGRRLHGVQGIAANHGVSPAGSAAGPALC